MRTGLLLLFWMFFLVDVKSFEIPVRPDQCDAKIKGADFGPWVLGSAATVNGIMKALKFNKNIFQRFPKNNSKNFAITFDDGPNDSYMIEVLDFLYFYNLNNPESKIKVTFFLLGSRVKGSGMAISRAVKEGHEIQIHGWDQKEAWAGELFGGDPSPSEVLADVCKTRTEILESLESDIRSNIDLSRNLTWVRPPYGLIGPRQSNKLEKYGFKISLPTIMPGSLIKGEDGVRRFVEATSLVIPRILKSANKPGSVLVLHNGEFNGNLEDRIWDSPCAAQNISTMASKLINLNFIPISELYKNSFPNHKLRPAMCD